MDILLQFASLAGVAAIITVIINFLKGLGVVKDGTAQTWSAGLNLVAMAILLALKVFVPTFNIAGMDEKLLAIAPIATTILGYILQLLASKLTYIAVRNVPVVGRSNTQ